MCVQIINVRIIVLSLSILAGTFSGAKDNAIIGQPGVKVISNECEIWPVYSLTRFIL